jgi:hypothetical protein
VNIIADLCVREANDPNTEPLKNLGPPCVIACEPSVLLAVQFDHQLGGAAVEIDRVSIERDLPAPSRREPRSCDHRIAPARVIRCRKARAN